MPIQDNEEVAIEETQSVSDRNTKSVGKLVHELVSVAKLHHSLCI